MHQRNPTPLPLTATGDKDRHGFGTGRFSQAAGDQRSGYVQEFVNITRANVTLRGNPTAEIVARDNDHDLLTVSADKVTLENLTLTGGLTGLSLNHAPSFYADKVVVQDASEVGVRVRVGDARLNNCTVQRSGNIGDVVRGGTAILGSCQVLDSGQSGYRALKIHS